MTTNYHTPITYGAPANANVFNAPLGQLDQTIAARTAEIMAARGEYANLAARLDSIVAAGGNISTLVNGAHSGGVSQIAVDSSAGFMVGARIVYLLASGRVEYNQVESVPDATHLAVSATTGGGIADNSVLAMISESEYQAASAVHHSGSITLDTAMEIASERVYSPVAYGAAGDGLTDDRAALDTLVNGTAIPATGGVLLIDRPYRVATGLEIPANVTVRVTDGGYFTVDAGKTLTIQGPLQAGLYHIFKGNGSITMAGGSVDAAYVQWWGAKADHGSGNTNLSPILAKAWTACKVVRIPAGNYYFDGQLIPPTTGLIVAGSPGTTLHCASAFIWVTGGNILIDSLEVRDIHFINLGTSGGGSNDDPCIYTTTSSTVGILRSRFENLEIEGFSQGIGIHGGTTYAQGYDLWSPPNFVGDMNGLEGRNTITGCYIHGCLNQDPPDTQASAPAIYARGGYWQISGNRIDGMNDGIMAASWSTITGNHITNIYYGNGIYANSTNKTTIANNYFENTRGDGIALNGAIGVTISGNVFVNCLGSVIRIQKSSLITITSNYAYGIPAHFVRGYTAAGDPVSYDVIISNNLVQHTDVSTSCDGIPLYFADGFYNVRIEGNIFRNLNVTATAISNHRIIYFVGPGRGRKIIGNTFDNIYPSPLTSTGQVQYFYGNTEEGENNFLFTDGGTLSTTQMASVRVIIGASGAIAYTDILDANGSLIAGVVKGTSTGEYLITLRRKVAFRSLTWVGSGANSPANLRFNYAMSNDTVSRYTDSITVTTLNASGATYWPNFSCVLMIGIQSMPLISEI